MTEQTWEYDCDLILAGQKIVKFTLTDHWQINHPEVSRELIVKLISRLNGKEVELRKVFRWRTSYQGKTYRLIFWLKDDTPNHLWIRNCYPID